MLKLSVTVHALTEDTRTTDFLPD